MFSILGQVLLQRHQLVSTQRWGEVSFFEHHGRMRGRRNFTIVFALRGMRHMCFVHQQDVLKNYMQYSMSKACNSTHVFFAIFAERTYNINSEKFMVLLVPVTFQENPPYCGKAYNWMGGPPASP